MSFSPATPPTPAPDREGGPLEKDTDVHVAAEGVAWLIEQIYYGGKTWQDSFLSMLPWMHYHGGILQRLMKSKLSETTALSGHDIAEEFRTLSHQIRLHFQSQATFFQMFVRSIPWLSTLLPEGFAPKIEMGPTTEMQRICNHRLWTHNEDGTVNRIVSDDLTKLFASKNAKDWPDLVLTSNHARANRTADLSELMDGTERILRDAKMGQKPLDLLRLRRDQIPDTAAGKTIIALACHTEADMLLNGAELIDRRLALQSDPNRNDPANRSLEGISPASVRLGKLILKLMLEPGSQGQVDLDRAIPPEDKHPPRYKAAPFAANDARYDGNFVLRGDAASIAQHIKLFGYSKGVNSVMGATRYLYQEFKALGDRLQIVGEKDGKEIVRAANDEDIHHILSNLGVLSIAPGEVPLSDNERAVGLNRVTIHNNNDLTAGHLVKPDREAYNRHSDRLVMLDGTTDEMGHSIVSMLGNKNKQGCIMDPANANKPGYKTARDEIKAWASSLYHVPAVTSLCFVAETKHPISDNVVYVQFAPGVSRAEEAHVKNPLIAALKKQGLSNVSIQVDLHERRRLRVVLDHDVEKHPVEQGKMEGNRYTTTASNHGLIQKFQAALTQLNRQDKEPPLFVTNDAFEYLNEMMAVNDAGPAGGGGRRQYVAAMRVAGRSRAQSTYTR